jgi:hypothetical protein
MSDTVLDKLAGVDPLLSNLIVGVGGDQNYIGEQALPVITTRAETVTYRKGSNAGLVQEGDTNTLRAPGHLPKEVDLSFDTAEVTLAEYMLMANLDYRDTQASQANPESVIDIKMAKLAAAKSKILLGKEQHIADLLFTSGNYTNSASNVDFGGAAGTLRPIIFAAKETVRKTSGYDPNTLILGTTSLIELLENADIKDMIKYSSGGVTYLELLAQFFGIERVLVGSAVKQTAAAAGAAGTGSYVWTADAAAMIYANRNAASPWNPSFGYLFQMPEFVAEWSNNPLITNMAYGQRYKGAVTFAGAGYFWSNTDQA